MKKLRIHTGRVVPIVDALLPWFAKNSRDLPWRRTRDPYAIWVSEIMLQQTQVKTVEPYWERWMRQLPTVEALAKARPARLHKLWEGLGYYTRVRNMHKAARQIMERHGGVFPDRYEDVLALPGIGRYTAGAICSIAFNQPTPLLDGNVTRVLTRLFGIRTDPREKETNERLWGIAEDLVGAAHTSTGRDIALRCPHPRNSGRNEVLLHAFDPDAPLRRSAARTAQRASASQCSALNQSLMELGALVCTPRQPRCGDCPVTHFCVARRKKCVDAIPNLQRAAPATARRFVAFVVKHGGKVLVRQRPAGVVNAHLWEFPNAEQLNGALVPALAKQALGFAPQKFSQLCTIKHTITRYRITLEVFAAAARGRANSAAGEWVPIRALERLAFSSAHRRIVERFDLWQADDN